MTRVSLDDLDAVPIGDLTWRPVRRALGTTAFGVSAWTAAHPGDHLIEPHDETTAGAAGHEELYLVLRGRARFTVAGDTFDAAPGTFVQVAVGTHREAVAAEADTAVVVIGGVPGAALPVSAHEFFAAAEPAYRAGDYARAVEIASEGLADWPDHGLLNYQLACYLALAGRLEEARTHLERAFAGDERTRAWAAQDADLAALR